MKYSRRFCCGVRLEELRWLSFEIDFGKNTCEDSEKFLAWVLVNCARIFLQGVVFAYLYQLGDDRARTSRCDQFRGLLSSLAMIWSFIGYVKPVLPEGCIDSDTCIGSTLWQCTGIVSTTYTTALR